MADPTYTLVTPDTVRSGPGTKSHLYVPGQSRTLCQVENNCRLHHERAERGTVDELKRWIRTYIPARKLCGNCEAIHKQWTPTTDTEEEV